MSNDPFRLLGPVVPVVRRLAEHVYSCTRSNGMSYMWVGQGYNAGNPPEHNTKRFFDFIIQNRADFNDGKYPTAKETADGWIVARWLMKHNKALRVAWIIYAGRIWNPGRDKYNVWRRYTGGFGVSGGHHNHIHVGVRNTGGSVPSERIPNSGGAASKPGAPGVRPFNGENVRRARLSNKFDGNVKLVQEKLIELGGLDLGPTGADGYWGSTDVSKATSYTQEAYDTFRWRQSDWASHPNAYRGSPGNESLQRLFGSDFRVV